MLLKNTSEKSFKYTFRYTAVVIHMNNSYPKDTAKSDIRFTACKNYIPSLERFIGAIAFNGINPRRVAPALMLAPLRDSVIQAR